MDKIRVLLVDDHPVIREGLSTILGTAADVEVVGEAGSGLEAIDKAREHRPEVLLMDIRMPELDGIEATRRIKSQFPTMSVIVLSTYDNDAYIVGAVSAGASGYLLKDVSKDLLIHHIREVSRGGMLIKTSLLHQVFSNLASAKNIPPAGISEVPPELNSLTPRERAVLRLMVEGQRNKEIAKVLAISEDTAKKHVQNIIAKLGVSDRTQAAVKAVRAGFFEHVA